MEHVVSEIIKIFTTMLFILLIVGMVIMGKHLSDVNTFKEYVNTQIERNGGYTEKVKTNVEKINKESYNDMFFMYEPDSDTPKKIETAPFGEIVNYEIHSNIPIPFTTSGTIKIPIAFKGQAISRIRVNNDPDPTPAPAPDPTYTHTAYSWSADGTDRFTTTKPNLNLISQNDLIPGYLSDKGVLISTSAEINDQTSPYLEVDVSQSYTAQVFITLSSISQKSWMSLNWFDSNQQFISRNAYEENTIPSAGYYNYRHTVQPPSNAKFVRLSFRTYNNGKLKLEQGSVATPLDQPKYIGTYTDKSETASQDPSKYTWKLAE